MNLPELPTSRATEERIIACELDRGTTALLAVIEAGVVPATFSNPFCRRIHELILQRHAAGLPFALNDVFECLKPGFSETDVLLEITRHERGDMMILDRLCAEIVHLATRRSVIGLSADLANAAKSDPDQVSGIIGSLLATQAGSVKSRSWTKVCGDATVRAQNAIAGRTNEKETLSWGWPQLDRAFKPMKRGELVVFAARPSLGKSSAGRQIAVAAAVSGHSVLFESLEVSTDDVIDGMASGYSGLSTGELSRIPLEHQRQFLQAIDTLHSSKLQVHEDRTLAGIIARAKAIQAQDPLTLLVIDYLGLIADCRPSKGETTSQAVGAVTKALKRLAMELRIVIVCLAQLNRQAANDGNREPRLSDLRDSGDIEQDADRVVFIHRPDECPITKRHQDVLEDVDALPRYGCALIQAKGRNVGTGYGSVWFNRRLARFEFSS